ncbi:MAG: IS630 family transposase [Candidatus Angelobacter sp.]
MRVAPAITLDQQQRNQLQAWARGRSLPQRQVERAKIILLAAAGKQDIEIAAALRIDRQKAARCRRRFLRSGMAGLAKDGSRPGRPRRIDAEEIVRITTQQTPAHATHWSTRSLAQVAGVSEATVRRVWRAFGLKPHRVESFKLSHDPQFVEKLEDIVGLYLNPPQHAAVFSADEKSQIQALQRTQPSLPLKPGRSQSLTHDYKRHGTTTLFAALNILDGTVLSQCRSRHTHQDWLAFLRQIDQETHQDKQIHVIADNYAAHKHPTVRRWLQRHPRFHMHYTPTSASWLNMVERLFRDLTQQRLRRGVFHSVAELIDAIEKYLADHNRHPKPFVWTAKACDILEKVTRARRTLDMVQSK